MQIKNILLAFSFLMVLGGMQSLFAQDSQETVVKGKIYDAKTKEPLVGVAVWVKDTPHSSMSDLDGNYELRFTGNYGYVTFSLLGYAEKEVAVKKGNQVINVALEEDMNTLEEAVAVGYGSQKRASIIGSISTVDPISLQVPVANVSSALAGRLMNDVRPENFMDILMKLFRGCERLNSLASASRAWPIFADTWLIACSLACSICSVVHQLLAGAE